MNYNINIAGVPLPGLPSVRGRRSTSGVELWSEVHGVPRRGCERSSGFGREWSSDNVVGLDIRRPAGFDSQCALKILKFVTVSCISLSYVQVYRVRQNKVAP